MFVKRILSSSYNYCIEMYAQPMMVAPQPVMMAPPPMYAPPPQAGPTIITVGGNNNSGDGSPCPACGK